MEGNQQALRKAWQLPLVVAAITVPVVAATLLTGPAGGLAAAFLTASAIVLLAARAKPDEPIEGTGLAHGNVLVVACTAIDGPGTLAPVLAAVGAHAGDESGVLVLAPAYTGRLASWTSDLQAGRLAAAERLVVTLAGMAAAGVDAHSRVGDSDPLVATEDAIREWPAAAIVFVTEADDARGARAAAEVARRANVPVRHIALEGAPVAG